MSLSETLSHERTPSRAVSIAVSAALVIVWGAIRLAVFHTVIFPLTYVIPLLVCVWTRDRIALWSMAAIFAVLHTVKLQWILPYGAMTAAEWWANYTAPLLNILIGASIVQMILILRDRLDAAMNDLREQAEELRVQGEELAQQNEELAVQGEELSRQTEELSQQGEELANQNEELQSQTDEIRTLNTTLERREGLLQTLLETATVSGTEHEALRQIAEAAMDLLDPAATAVAIYEAGAAGRLQALAVAPASATPGDDARIDDGFVRLVLHENRTASLNQVSLRPDLQLASMPGRDPFGAVVCAPVRLGDKAIGGFAVYSAAAHDWTDEEFRLTEWLGDQCSRVLQAVRLQATLRDADRRKSEFLATLSHELRNPLAPITFALTLLESGRGRGENHIQILRRQVQQLTRLVDDLLDATRLSSNKIQIRKVRADLVAVVRHAVDAVRHDLESAGHAIIVRLPAEPVWLEIDADRIAQVVTNLLNNATRYTPAGGTVAVAVGVDQDEAMLSVSDTGIGLHAADLDRVFDMFTQVGEPGSGGLGIGLALVRGIAELHAGRVEARSDGIGRGCEFRVILPAVIAQAPAVAVGSTGASAGNGTYRVLVVDDNYDSAEMMSELLALHGHTVRTEHDAESGLRAAREFAPHTALLDIGLPGFDGYELARCLRQDEQTRTIRLVAVTGWGQATDRARAQQAGFDAHLTKPAEPDRILAAVAAVEPV